VGVYFVTQNPRDIPDRVLGQLGNRVQHALRAFTPADQKAVRAAAETFRANPKLETASVLTELGVGEALVSLLDEKGQPGVVERALIVPPRSQIGPITPAQRQQIIAGSVVAGVYERVVDRESAYERLTGIHGAAPAAGGGSASASPNPLSAPAAPPESKSFWSSLLGGGPAGASPVPGLPRALPKSGGRRSDDLMTVMAKSTVRTIGSTVGRELVRGLLGSILGGGGRRR
jgi:DNA helicase HerA-like ATPase